MLTRRPGPAIVAYSPPLVQVTQVYSPRLPATIIRARSPLPDVVASSGRKSPPPAVFRAVQSVPLEPVQLPPHLRDIALGFRDTFERVEEELKNANEDVAREEQDQQAVHREIREDLAKEQERIRRIASNIEQVLVDLRSGAAEMRRRNAALRESFAGLRSETNSGLDSMRTSRETLFGVIENNLAGIDDRRMEEQQEGEVQVASLRNELINALAQRVQQEVPVRVQLLGRTSEVNGMLQLENRERVQRDALVEQQLDEARGNLQGTRARVDETRRNVEKETGERERAQGEIKVDLDKLRTRLQRVQRDYEAVIADSDKHAASKSTVGTTPRSVATTTVGGRKLINSSVCSSVVVPASSFSVVSSNNGYLGGWNGRLASGGTGESSGPPTMYANSNIVFNGGSGGGGDVLNASMRTAMGI